MTKFEIERVKYLISQANKQTVTGLNKADAEILEKLIDYFNKYEDLCK